MSDQGFFLTVAGIGMSFAGFAGLLNAFRGGAGWDPLLLYQLRVIVAYAVATLFAALSTVPVAGLIGQRDAVTAIASTMTVLSFVLGIWAMRGDLRMTHGTAVRTPVRAGFALLTILAAVAAISAALTGAVPLFQAALLLWLANPAANFVYVISRIDR